MVEDEPRRASPRAWPATFPHAEIDALLRRLDSADAGGGGANRSDAARLLRLIGQEAQRLRTSVTQRSMERLDEAEREAADVLARAHADAERVRRLALRAVEDRLDETEVLFSAMRRAFTVDHSIAGSTLDPPRGPVGEEAS